MKALLQYRASPGFRAALDAAGRRAGVETAVVDETDAAGFAREIADTDLLLHVLKPVSAAMMDQGPRLRLIQKIGIGVNTIDLAAARDRAIAVCNMPGSNSQAVAEMTLMLMLAVLRRTAWLDARTRAGRGWSLDLDVVDRFGEIGGRVVGFVGYGAIPQRLTPALEALGARVIYTATRANPDRPDGYRTFETLLAEADIVSLHAPLTEQTREMMDAAAFARLRPGAILVNTARGGLVNEAALAEALDSGRLAGAGLDVFAEEPVDPGHPLARFETVVMTPHLAWLTPETLDRSLGIAMDNAARLLAGQPLLHQVT
jgi:phosphoglycerate dehydrogenase-like enzyme